MPINIGGLGHLLSIRRVLALELARVSEALPLERKTEGVPGRVSLMVWDFGSFAVT